MSIEKPSKPTPSVHEQMFKTPEQPVMPYHTKSVKFEDLYKRATVYIENNTLAKLNDIAGREKGEKTKIINEALQEYFKNHGYE